MSAHHHAHLTRIPRRKLLPTIAAMVALVAGPVLALNAGQTATAELSPSAVLLGTASSYAVLAGQGVTNTGPTTVSGNLGVSPDAAVTGFPPGIVNAGTIHAADAEAAQAQSDLIIAYDDAAGRSSTETVSADLAGQTLVGGVYTGGALGLTGALTLDGQNDPNALFVFQAASTLITGSNSSVNLINGAQACNVFWQVGSSATLGTGTDFVGTILALTSISVTTGATVEGRALARNGAVTLDTNTFTQPGCEFVASTTTTTPETTTPATTTPATTPEATTAQTTTPATPTTSVFPPTDITLPSTGGGSLATQSGVGLVVLLVGLAALFTARRRQPASSR